MRQKLKALSLGYFTREFPFKLHLPDVHDINNSMAERSGGPIRDNLRRSLEEMGGAPTRAYKVSPVKCPHHWSKTYGVFEPKAGHKQGEIVVEGRLAAYISIHRHGEFAIYTQIIGHGEDLGNGVLTLLFLAHSAATASRTLIIVRRFRVVVAAL
ncbi:hypothetical protein SAMN05216555_1128 [Arthrobacter cupressi]|uniref:Uncharacterized protein n=1 Tax=Arthrobacter cupressi TaxID=1045773 RepID=A0A1G8UI01_9MICC|nr:hypothetical protein [Arthrobacter cupressi]SDJ53422.1 hypothetical protein SAMN05216555_1128 [Arthrobacter cupressi]